MVTLARRSTLGAAADPPPSFGVEGELPSLRCHDIQTEPRPRAGKDIAVVRRWNDLCRVSPETKTSVIVKDPDASRIAKLVTVDPGMRFARPGWTRASIKDAECI
jgi:hypothetical protein